MNLLELSNLTLDIHGAPILRAVSMAVEAGKFLGVRGGSGSGN